VTSTSPRYGETARRYSAVSLEGGEIEALELGSTGIAETSVALLTPLRANHSEPLIVIGDNGPAPGGEALRTYLTTPDLRPRLVRLPAPSPDFNADEAITGPACAARPSQPSAFGDAAAADVMVQVLGRARRRHGGLSPARARPCRRQRSERPHVPGGAPPPASRPIVR
jgi:hypothetical protein